MPVLPGNRQTTANTSEKPLISFTRPQCGQVASHDSIIMTMRGTPSTDTSTSHSLQKKRGLSSMTSDMRPQQSSTRKQSDATHHGEDMGLAHALLKISMLVDFKGNCSLRFAFGRTCA
jgi:hypothetical protein